jgi:hypothetical protein
MPQREISFVDNRLTATSESTTYTAKELSDGERVAFYLLGQCLLVRDGSTVIIDEPELHLHRSLMSRLWTLVEKERPDCLFVYITHDLDFAASRVGARKLWVKSYDGGIWNWKEVPSDVDLPEDVLFEVLGSRKKILFVEGQRGSFDKPFYELLYPDYTVIARGGCAEVIDSVGALRKNGNQHYSDCKGIVDRDYRSEQELKARRSFGIEVLEFAEIENLYCSEFLLRAVAARVGVNETTIQSAKERLFVLLQSELNMQSKAMALSLLKHELQMWNAKPNEATEVGDQFDTFVKSVDVSSIYTRSRAVFEKVLADKDYSGLLRVFNNKGTLTAVSSCLGFKGPDFYRSAVLAILQSSEGAGILKELRSLLPVL